MANKDRLIKRFIEYVKIDSLSGEEQKFTKRLVSDLKKLGIKTSKDKTGNLFAIVRGSIKNAPMIMLNAHIDTVGPGKNIKPVIKKGVIKSSGKTILGADDKAGVAAVVEALHILKENKIPHGGIQLVFTVKEEIGLVGAGQIKKNKIKAKYGFVLDGGAVHKINNAAPSQKNINVEIIGRAAHAGVHPEEGINAIVVASQAISKMKLGRIDKETTSNIGIIKGGRATNIIPDRVELKGEARSHNPQKLKRQIKHMKDTLAHYCKRNKAKVKIQIKTMYEAFLVKESEEVLKIAKRAYEGLGQGPGRGQGIVVERSGGGSDANVFNKLGVPCVIIGVGGTKFHTVDEKLPIDQFALGTNYLLEIIKLCAKRQ